MSRTDASVRSGWVAVMSAALLMTAPLAGAEGVERVNVPGVGRLPAFSHAAVAGDLVFVSGMLGTRPGTTDVVPGGIGAETGAALAHMETILGAVGATRKDVAKCTVFLRTMDDYAAMNEAWLGFFQADVPARSTVAVADLARGATIEVECIAARPETSGRPGSPARLSAP